MAKTRRAYLNLDGTLTYWNTEDTFTHPTFKDLLRGLESISELTEDKATSILSMQDSGHGLILSKGAIAFINELLKLDFSITIVSKNYEVIIRSLLLAAELPKDVLAKITIIDRNHLQKYKRKHGANLKYHAVAELEAQADRAELILVCDDHKPDHDDMVRAARPHCDTMVNFAKMPVIKGAKVREINVKEVMGKIKDALNKPKPVVKDRDSTSSLTSERKLSSETAMPAPTPPATVRQDSSGKLPLSDGSTLDASQANGRLLLNLGDSQTSLGNSQGSLGYESLDTPKDPIIKTLDFDRSISEFSQPEKKTYSIAAPIIACKVSGLGLFTANSVAAGGVAASWGLFAQACAAIPLWGWVALLAVSVMWLARNVYQRCKQDDNGGNQEPSRRLSLVSH